MDGFGLFQMIIRNDLLIRIHLQTYCTQPFFLALQCYALIDSANGEKSDSVTIQAQYELKNDVVSALYALESVYAAKSRVHLEINRCYSGYLTI